MNEINTTGTEYIVVDNQPFVTIREAARLLDVTQTAFDNYCSRHLEASTKLPKFEVRGVFVKHLAPTNIIKAASYYAAKGNAQALAFITDTAQRSIGIYLHNAAGVPIPSEALGVNTVARLESAKVAVEIAELTAKANRILKESELLSSDNAVSAAILIDEWGVDISVIEFDKLCQQHKLLSKRQPLQVTHKGFTYGTNFNSGTTKQPRWYRHTFSALCQLLNIT